MAYIGNVPAEKYIALTQQTFSSPTGTSFTLSQAVTNPVDIDLYIDNVKQDPASYSVSGTALTTSTIASPSTMYCIYNGKAMQTVNPPDDSVGLSQMASGTDGNVITFDASGNPAYVATGNDGQVLTSAGAGAAPAFETLTASGWEYVSVGTASNSASVAFTNMASGYDYQYVIDNLFHVTNNTGFNYQLGVAGPTYRTSGYLSTIAMMNNAGTSQGTVVTGHIQIISDGIEQMGDQTDEGAYRIVLELTDPAGTSNKTGGFSRASFYGASPQLVTELGDGVYTSAAEAHVAIKFQSTSGNMTTGTFLQYRRKRS